MAGPSSQNPTDAADGKRSAARIGRASNRPKLTDPVNAGKTQPLLKSTRSPREKIDTSRAPLATTVCGKIVAATNKKVRVPPAELKGYRLRCVICNEALRNHQLVFSHFVPCVRRNGNPGGAHWHDHESIDNDKIPNSLRCPAEMGE